MGAMETGGFVLKIPQKKDPLMHGLIFSSFPDVDSPGNKRQAHQPYKGLLFYGSPGSQAAMHERRCSGQLL